MALPSPPDSQTSSPEKTAMPQLEASSVSRKQRRPPTVTPRSFKRFFTPKSLPVPKLNLTRQPLGSLSASATNSRSQPSRDDTSSPLKRRKIDQSSSDSESDSDQDAPAVTSSIAPSSKSLLLRETLGRRRLTGWSETICRAQTTAFVSGPSDCFRAEAPSGRPPVPFCIASCNKNSLVASGAEDGSISLLETDQHAGLFRNAFLTFQPHHNAIIDMQFSSDDLLLATASGDQTCQIIDMPKQQTIVSMPGHTASLKQVRFQPGSTTVLATSSRDGGIRIWDTRCPSLAGRKAIDTIPDAHMTQKSKPDTPRGAVSVTAIEFLPLGREHLLLSGSEANASVRLWDLRATRKVRRGIALPLSSTQLPASHIAHRNYGLNSLALSTDAARLYTLCRDNSVYAYSVQHLILGHAPQLDRHARRPFLPGEKTGLGPLHALRHSSLHVNTFYNKCAIRPATPEHPELLACGSSDRLPIIFSTLEGNSRGTALVRGHDEEVSAIVWAKTGTLLTASDDRTVRCWRENDLRAHNLRTQGEVEGARWGCGWASITESESY